MERPDAKREPGEATARRLWIWSLLALAVGFFVAWQFVGDPPPRTIVVATGGEGGGYDRGGQALADELRDDGITVELRRTEGTLENLRLLREGEVDLAFVQGGVGAARDDGGLRGIASLYFEPLWIFVGSEPAAGATLSDLRGKRLQVGPPGSGTRPVATELLAASGVTEADATFLDDGPDEAAASLRRGDCDAVLLVTSPQARVVRELAIAEGVFSLSLPRAHALSRHFGYLEPLVLTEGMLDLALDLPTEPVDLVAPAACWVARDDLHPAIAPLLIQAGERIYGDRGLFEDAGQFPSPHRLEFEVAKAADNYFRRGPSWLYRVLPFQVAATLDRLKILLLPLLTLLLPLIKLAPPLYRWRMRSRITRWYRALLEAERRVRRDPSTETVEAVDRDLERLDQELAQVQVPLSFAEELYNVRMHLRYVRRSVNGMAPGA